MALGIVFSVLASSCFSLSNLLEKLAVDRMPAISPGRAVHMFHLLRRSGIWLGGFAAGAVAVVLTTLAYALSPIAIVQSVIGAGLVVVVIFSRLAFHETIGPKEWVGLTVILVAVVLVSLSLIGSDTPGTRGSLLVAVMASVATLLVAAAGFLLLHRGVADHSISYGVAAGLLYGVAALQAKSASVLMVKDGFIASIPKILATPYPYLFVLTSLVGLAVFQTGLQRSRVGVVAPLTNIVASVYVVAIGMAVFDEPLPSSTVLTVLRLTGFVLVLFGSSFFADGAVSVARTSATEPGAPVGALSRKNN